MAAGRHVEFKWNLNNFCSSEAIFTKFSGMIPHVMFYLRIHKNYATTKNKVAAGRHVEFKLDLNNFSSIVTIFPKFLGMISHVVFYLRIHQKFLHDKKQGSRRPPCII